MPGSRTLSHHCTSVAFFKPEARQLIKISAAHERLMNAHSGFYEALPRLTTQLPVASMITQTLIEIE